MYSGRITEMGRVRETGGALTVTAPMTARALQVGGSVSVNGVCVSAVRVDGDSFAADVSVETGRRSGDP